MTPWGPKKTMNRTPTPPSHFWVSCCSLEKLPLFFAAKREWRSNTDFRKRIVFLYKLYITSTPEGKLSGVSGVVIPAGDQLLLTETMLETKLFSREDECTLHVVRRQNHENVRKWVTKWWESKTPDSVRDALSTYYPHWIWDETDGLSYADTWRNHMNCERKRRWSQVVIVGESRAVRLTFQVSFFPSITDGRILMGLQVLQQHQKTAHERLNIMLNNTLHLTSW